MNDKAVGITSPEVRVNLWLAMPIGLVLLVIAIQSVTTGDWSEAVLAVFTFVLGLQFIEREKAVASIMIQNYQLKLALIETLEQITKKEKEDGCLNDDNNKGESEVSRD